MSWPFSNDQWIQRYPPNNTPMVRSEGDPSSDQTDSPTGNKTPTARRRSRASRRTPVTVLNATPTDFRALVQRFTGCDSSSQDHSASASSAVNFPKGPVNIDFTKNDVTAAESSSISRYMYGDQNQPVIRSTLRVAVDDHEHVQSVAGGGSWSTHMQPNSYRVENNMENGSDDFNYEAMNLSDSFMENRRDGGYNS